MYGRAVGLVGVGPGAVRAHNDSEQFCQRAAVARDDESAPRSVCSAVAGEGLVRLPAPIDYPAPAACRLAVALGGRAVEQERVAVGIAPADVAPLISPTADSPHQPEKENAEELAAIHS